MKENEFEYKLFELIKEYTGHDFNKGVFPTTMTLRLLKDSPTQIEFEGIMIGASK